MANRVILITGTPCVGKTAVAKKLTEQLNAIYVNLTALALKHDLILGEDKERHTTVVDERKMKAKVSNIIETAEKGDVVIDGHYASAVTPKEKVTHAFVLRRNPIQLREFMEKCGFKNQKLWENLASEILDVCLVEAVREQEAERICELDVTNKTVEEITQEIKAVIDDRKKCHFGGIDWLGMLEKDGKLEEYLRI
jgi:adenylate kinase